MKFQRYGVAVIALAKKVKYKEWRLTTRPTRRFSTRESNKINLNSFFLSLLSLFRNSFASTSLRDLLRFYSVGADGGQIRSRGISWNTNSFSSSSSPLGRERETEQLLLSRNTLALDGVRPLSEWVKDVDSARVDVVTFCPPLTKSQNSLEGQKRYRFAEKGPANGYFCVVRRPVDPGSYIYKGATFALSSIEEARSGKSRHMSLVMTV